MAPVALYLDAESQPLTITAPTSSLRTLAITALSCAGAFLAGSAVARCLLPPPGGVALYLPAASATSRVALAAVRPNLAPPSGTLLRPLTLPVGPHRSGSHSALRVFAEGVHDFTVKDASGKDIPLSDFRGKVLLIVNVDSNSLFTPQYRELQELQNKYAGMPFTVLAFPSDQLQREAAEDEDWVARQPKPAAEEAEYAKTHFAATFPVMDRVDVNGETAAPLFRFLKEQRQAVPLIHDVKASFEKFLVDKEGEVVQHYTALRGPLSIVSDIDALLAK